MNKNRIITIGGTVMCVLGIGYFMQTSVSDQPAPGVTAEPVSRSEFKPLSEPISVPGVDKQMAPDVSRDTAEPLPEMPVRQQSMLGADLGQIAATVLPEPKLDVSLPSVSEEGNETLRADPVQMATLDEPEPQSAPSVEVLRDPEPACDVQANAVTDAAAMVRATLSAPCYANQRVMVHHQGLMFSVTTDGNGDLDVMIPALSETAVIIFNLGDGEGAVATAEVSSLAFYDRIVLQWAGTTGFELHAREFGADYDTEGHVWRGAPRDMTTAALGDGGFVIRLGDEDMIEPRLADVYTFPAATATREGRIDVTVEAEVTAMNCGKEIEAETITRLSNGDLATNYLTMASPDCEAIGDFLVLNNLLEDLTIARN